MALILNRVYSLMSAFSSLGFTSESSSAYVQSATSASASDHDLWCSCHGDHADHAPDFLLSRTFRLHHPRASSIRHLPARPLPPGSRLILDFSPAWAEAKARAKKLVSGWTLKLEVNVSTGIGSVGNCCVGNIAAVGDDWLGLCLGDGPLGVRATDVKVFPAGVNAAAWNRTLIYARACAKHYINNEEENLRIQELPNVDDRTEHENFVHPFMWVVQAGVASVMCSYTLVSDTFACEKGRTPNQILKDELGFQGYIVSDWAAQRSALAAVAGLDMQVSADIIPGSGTSWFGMTDMAERVVTAWYLPGRDNYPEVSFDAATSKLVHELGAASVVLLKNIAAALPLNKPRSPAIAGNDSGSGTANFSYLLEAIQARAREDRFSIPWFLSNWDLAVALGQDVVLVFANADSGEGSVILGDSSPESQNVILVDGTAGNRTNVTLWSNADILINAVAAVNPNTVVVVHSDGPAIIERWIENPNVTAVLWAGLPGQESGNALVDVMYGAVSSSGRLPYTIAKNLADYPAQLVTAIENTTGHAGWYPLPVFIIEYTEGLYIDYRHFDANGIEPRFPFGFGLSYTNFASAHLRVQAVHHDDVDSAALGAA
ncbi:glycosyl hydrolase family 3 C-terminal domain-containing protein [Ganoderma leucocontextum]|nr:glycosyl hydrolase family 3 C-terminal domain-containing protein [Ganoderma leucocontextum]